MSNTERDDAVTRMVMDFPMTARDFEVVHSYAESMGTTDAAVLAAALRMGLTTLEAAKITMEKLLECGREARAELAERQPPAGGVN